MCETTSKCRGLTCNNCFTRFAEMIRACTSADELQRIIMAIEADIYLAEVNLHAHGHGFDPDARQAS